MRCVTLGPFPPGKPLTAELAEIRRVGFNAVRVYEPPSYQFLEEAAAQQLWVFASVPWEWGTDFLAQRSLWKEAYAKISAFLIQFGDHPALAGLYIANEIPTTVLRWSDPLKVKEVLEAGIQTFRALRPNLLYAYANFPTTEYFELENANFTAFNVYLEREEALRSYLRHLQVVAGDRPLLLSEFGVDRGSHSREEVERIHRLAWRVSQEEGCAGLTIFAWSDVWWNRGQLVTGWYFGLKTVEDVLLPEAAAVTQNNEAAQAPGLFSLIVCSFNGERRIGACLEALLEVEDRDFEVIVVDDGSVDATAQKALSYQPAFEVRKIPFQVLSSPNEGLSAARNRGAEAARGRFLAYTDDDARPDREWVYWLRRGFAESDRIAAVGGHGFVPSEGVSEAVRAYPGQACPVLLSDDRAEHLPGCNLAVRRVVWQEVGGFRTQYRVAGDDVDFCWRVMEAGYTLQFQPLAYVWHEMRATRWAYLRQQWGYGKAEALLYQDHPARFSNTGTRWEGAVYANCPVLSGGGSVIYEGAAGMAPFQPITQHGEPEESFPLETRTMGVLQRWTRALARWEGGFPFCSSQLPPLFGAMRFLLPKVLWAKGRLPWHWRRAPVMTFWREELAARPEILELFVQHGWTLCTSPHWDLWRVGEGLQLLLEEPGPSGQVLKIRGNELADARKVLEKTAWRML